MELYPLKFEPISKYRIWGGDKLNSVLKKGFNGESLGESWEISGVRHDETVVAQGFLKGKTLKQIADTYKGQFLGQNVYEQFKNEFPLLIKFIDAKTPLSVQVHPNDAIAKERHDSFGKNEMWYIMDADDNAEIIVGFTKPLTKNAYEEHLNNGTILNILNTVSVEKGDAFHIPTGRVHAIGSGVLLAEIQQTSDVTYRIYDYDRVDKISGQKRELHNDLALDVLDFDVVENYKTKYRSEPNISNKLIHTPYFRTNYLNIIGDYEKDYSDIDSFIIYICVGGQAEIMSNQQTYNLQRGETLLIPAELKNINIQSKDAELLEVYY